MNPGIARITIYALASHWENIHFIVKIFYRYINRQIYPYDLKSKKKINTKHEILKVIIKLPIQVK